MFDGKGASSSTSNRADVFVVELETNSALGMALKALGACVGSSTVELSVAVGMVPLAPSLGAEVVFGLRLGAKVPWLGEDVTSGPRLETKVGELVTMDGADVMGGWVGFPQDLQEQPHRFVQSTSREVMAQRY